MKSAAKIYSDRAARSMCQADGCQRGSLIVLRGTSFCLDHYVVTLAAIARVSPTVRAFTGEVLQLATATARPELARVA